MPYAAPSRCSQQGCRNYTTRKGRCEEHQTGGFQSQVNRRRDRDRNMASRSEVTSTEWQTIWGETMRDHDRICHVCGKPNADQVDHILAIALGGARTDRANLAPIHAEPCHRLKTARELAELRRRAKAAKDAPIAGELA